MHWRGRALLKWMGVSSLVSLSAAAQVTVPLAQKIEHRGRPFTVVSIPLDDYKIDLVHEPSARKVSQRYSPLLMMNAGMFHPNHSPVGLQIIGGEILKPLNIDEGEGNFFLKPNGVFAMSEEETIIQDAASFDVSKSWRIATQSGPLLLQDGVYHPKIDPESLNVHIRNGLCTADGIVHLVISDEPVRFYDLASLMKERLGCADGLYLDGAISKLYQQTDQGWFPKLSRKPLGSWLVVFAKS